jgi:hypothetical protein
MGAIGDAVAQMFGSSSDKYAHGELRVRANTLVVGEAVYPVENISAVVLQDLRRPVPLFVWIMGAASVVLFVMGEYWTLLALPLLAMTILLLVQNFASRSAADFGLNVRMNGANTAVVLSDDQAFLKRIAQEIYEVIELGKQSITTFSIDNRVVIDSVTNSTLDITGMRVHPVDPVPIPVLADSVTHGMETHGTATLASEEWMGAPLSSQA